MWGKTIQILFLFIIVGCSSSNDYKKSEYELKKENMIARDSINKKNLIKKYKDLIFLDYKESEKLNTVDFELEKLENYCFESPRLLSIYKLEESIYAKYSQFSSPYDYIIILKVDTTKNSINKLKENDYPDFIVAKAKFLEENKLSNDEAILLTGDLIEFIQ